MEHTYAHNSLHSYCSLTLDPWFSGTDRRFSGPIEAFWAQGFAGTSEIGLLKPNFPIRGPVASITSAAVSAPPTTSTLDVLLLEDIQSQDTSAQNKDQVLPCCQTERCQNDLSQFFVLAIHPG